MARSKKGGNRHREEAVEPAAKTHRKAPRVSAAQTEDQEMELATEAAEEATEEEEAARKTLEVPAFEASEQQVLLIGNVSARSQTLNTLDLMMRKHCIAARQVLAHFARGLAYHMLHQ